MKTFYILNHKFLPTPYNHRFFVEKFARGFNYHGFDVKVVSKIKDITEPGFVIISNHYFFHSFGLNSLSKNIFGDYLRKAFSFILKIDKTGLFNLFCKILQKNTINRLSKNINNKNIFVLAWFWFEDSEYLNSKIKNIIFTGEKHYKEPFFDFGKKWFYFYNDNKNSLPIEFSADIDPNTLGNVKNKIINVGFVGNKNYKVDWYSLFINNSDCRILPTPPFISESERIKTYEESKVILGLHAEDNIKNHVVVERVFEALAFGCVCVTDNEDSVIATNGVAIFVKNKEELLLKVNEIINNDELFKKISNDGIKFAKEKGTYAFQASRFIELSEKLFKNNI